MHDVQKRQVKKLPALRGRTVINLFFEDSTRTRSSFEIAGKWLSADTINITGKGSSTRSEEHTSELQSLMRISYAVFCLKKKKNQNTHRKTPIMTQEKKTTNEHNRLNIRT